MGTVVKRTYKYKNIAAALAVLLFLLLIISTSCHKNKDNGTAQLAKKNDSSSSAADSKNDSDSEVRLTQNYKYETFENKTAVGNGRLVIVNDEHPFSGKAENLTTVYPYLFDDEGNQLIYASGSDLNGNEEMFKSFNKMASDFYKETGLATLLISGAYTGVSSQNDQTDEEEASSDSSSEQEERSQSSVDESSTGLVIDLQLYDNGEYPEYTGTGEYSWITSNCYKYGFIVEDPNDKPSRFRYVGSVFAKIMNSKDMPLTKFNDFIKDYSFEKPFSFTDEDDNDFLLYYIPADSGDTTNIPIPFMEDGSKYNYEVSGNNIDGYIVCVDVDGATNSVDDNSELSSEEHDTDDSSDDLSEQGEL